MAALKLENPQAFLISPSPVARRLFWHVLALGLAWYDDPVRYPALTKAGAALLWGERGVGRLTLGATTFVLRSAPEFWLFSLQQPRVFCGAEGKSVAVRSVRFSGPGLDTWLELLGVATNPRLTLRPVPALAVRAAWRKLLRLAQLKPPYWEWKIHVLLTELLQKCLTARRVLSAEQVPLPEEITGALNALAADPFRDWKASELAARAGLNYTRFRALFRKHMHESVHEHLQRQRVDLAQTLLPNHRLRIKEIAEKLHFASEHYFSHFFRNRTGMTPTEFRTHLGVREKPST